MLNVASPESPDPAQRFDTNTFISRERSTKAAANILDFEQDEIGRECIVIEYTK